jgi:riboflavin synthase
VNGACLTATEFDAAENGGWFKVWLANETLERTDLGTLFGSLLLLLCLGVVFVVFCTTDSLCI